MFFYCIDSGFVFHPALIKVAFLKRLFDEPGGAKNSHTHSANDWGNNHFCSNTFSFALWFPYDFPDMELLRKWTREFQFIVCSLLIIFFVGIKDDIIGTAPIKKLASQIIVGMILVLMAEIRIRSLHGLFGVQDIPLWASVFLTLFVYIVSINAFNLIDGVDGLAAGLGLLGGLGFGFYFSLLMIL